MYTIEPATLRQDRFGRTGRGPRRDFPSLANHRMTQITGDGNPEDTDLPGRGESQLTLGARGLISPKQGHSKGWLFFLRSLHPVVQNLNKKLEKRLKKVEISS